MTTPNRRRAARRYTIIEMVAALTVFLIAAGAVVAVAAGGLRIYQRARTYNLGQADLLLALERIERDLRNAFVIGPIPFTGNGSRVRVPGIVTAPNADGQLVHMPGDLTYYVDSLAGGLVLRRRGYADAVADTESGGKTTVLARGVRTVTFSYLYYDADAKHYGWQEAWVQGGGIPVAVRLVVAADRTGPSARVERTVFIPTAEERPR